MTKSLNQAFIKAYSKEERLAQQATATEQPEPSVEDSYIVRFDTATVSVAPPHQATARSPGKRPPAVAAQRLPASAGQPSSAASHPEPSVVPAPKMQSAAPSVSVRHAEVIYSGDPSSAQQLSAPPTAKQTDPMQALRESIASQMVQAGSWEFPTLEPAPTQPAHRVDQAHSVPSPASQSVPVAPQQPAIQQAAASAAIQPAREPEAASPYAAQPLQPQPAQPQSTPLQSAAPQPAPQPAPTYREHAPIQHHDAPAAQAAPMQYRVDPVEATTATDIATDTASARATQTTSAPPQLQPLAEPALPQHSERHEKDGEIFRLDRPTYDPAINGEDSGDVSAASESASITSADPLAELSEADREAARAEAARKSAEAEQELRAAKKRIFNPVWEVDNFHWPDVCLDLLQQSGEQMDAVAENLSSACEEGLQVLAVTSPEGGEGRTTIACCLAMLAGSRGLNVAIVDADLEHPTLALQTNLELDQDWRTAVQHQIPLEEIAVHSIDDQVTLVPLVAPVEHAEMSTDDNRIASMFQELSESFDLVIADMGPMSSPRSLVSTMGEHGIISAVVSVVNRQETAAEQIEACIRRVRQSGIVSIGLVENFVS